MTEPTAQGTSSEAWRRPLRYAAVIACVLIILGVQDAGSIEVYGVSVPAWLFGLGMYLIGVLAMFSFQRR